MFGIGGGELFFIILVVLMLFGSDKIPEIARGLGRGMQQLKDATNEIKTEIHKSADVEGLKKTFTEIGTGDIENNITAEINKVKEDVDIEDLSGPIKRMK
ncbi:twin-arginine translocase TatA/TatE family subunit [Flavobacterium zepuense]|uniref:Sec-independent protein translocase protein TatA n=1 Tax=Flavobacterium zepuense TaxID=2593302 RepID=A0A552V7T8_9FLAO|nr:twin-arginine translocase TatA/TatE family subunit [Flavobacterium zepuense]TRW26536.1 twin-arginine translocase TatA/TatE family subunit [Flavobacterium zepuense]